MQRKLLSTIAILVASTLFVTGTSKIAAAFSPLRIVSVIDPIFHFELKTLLFLVGLLECSVGILWMMPRVSLLLKGQSIVALTSSILVYRIGLMTINWSKPCPCLGSLKDLFGLSDANVSRLAWTLIVLWITAGVTFWRNSQPSPIERSNQSALAEGNYAR